MLAQTSVNSGQSVFQRYSLYAGVPLLAWGGYCFGVLIKKKFFISALLGFAVTYVAAFNGPNAEEDYMLHKPWVKYIFNHVPSLYNPEPGIFYARTSGRELIEGERKAAIYKDPYGLIRKILYPIGLGEESIQFFCDGRLKDTNGQVVDWSRPAWEAYGWGYINGSYKCDGVELAEVIDIDSRYAASLNEGIDFSRRGFPYFIEYISGLSGLESWGRWTIGDQLVIKVKESSGKRFHVVMKVAAFSGNSGKPVIVQINGVEKNFIIEDGGSKDYRLEFELADVATEMIIRIKPPSPKSPASLGISNDSRLLGIAFNSLRFEPVN